MALILSKGRLLLINLNKKFLQANKSLDINFIIHNLHWNIAQYYTYFNIQDRHGKSMMPKFLNKRAVTTLNEWSLNWFVLVINLLENSILVGHDVFAKYKIPGSSTFLTTYSGFSSPFHGSWRAWVNLRDRGSGSYSKQQLNVSFRACIQTFKPLFSWLFALVLSSNNLILITPMFWQKG